MVRFGAPELLVVLIIIVLLFGIGRIGRIGKELGTGIRAFREGLSGDQKKDENSSDDEPKP